MTCPSCGRIVQPGAASCINVSCADYAKPFAQAVAVQIAPPLVVTSVRPLRTTALIAATCAGAYTLLILGSLLIPPTADPFSGVATAYIVVALMAGATLLGGFGSFVVWLYRARANIAAWPEARPRWTRGWAIGVWFAPFVNFFLGGLVVADVARESAAPRDDDTRRSVVRLVAVWWIALVLHVFMELGWVQLAEGETAARLINATALVVATVAFGAVLYRVTRLQERHQADGA
jgi:hypothetical protein